MSLVNHMYWCSLSTRSGDREMIAAKWKSIANHVQNKHSGLGEQFPKCRHGPLHGRETKIMVETKPVDIKVQGRTRTGGQFAIKYPKYKGGDYIVRQINQDCTYGYVDELLPEMD
ncbi:uncharacterized protein LOC102807632 [Saccoglossus kowalevskii]